MSSFTINELLVPSEALAKGVLISALDGTVLDATVPNTTCEFGAMLTTGVFGVLEIAGDPRHLVIYNSADFSIVATPSPFAALPNALSPVASNWNDTFYVGQVIAPSNAQVKAVSATGVVGGTTYTLAIPTLQAMAVNTAGTILYYGDSTVGAPLRRWNLTTNLAMANFLAGATTNAFGQEMIIHPPTGNLVVIMQPNSAVADWHLRCYTPAAALVWDRDLGNAEAAGDDIRLAIDLDDPLAIWTRENFSIDGTQATFNKRLAATGAVTHSFVATVGITHVPSSCPFFARSTTTTTTVDPIVVERTFLLPAETNLQMFLSRLELFCQSGVGLTSGQGSDPQVMLQISRDGGQTWGPERWRSMGQIGAYLQRTVWNRLGRGRNLVCRMRCSEPTVVAWLEAFATMDEGTS